MRTPDFWYARQPSLAAALMQPAAALFSAGGVLRQLLIKAEAAPVPVVCIGNLVAGGAGKTPVALALAGLARATGWQPAFLSRGYGGSFRQMALKVEPDIHRSTDVGDEALLLAALAPCWVARDRRQGAKLAAAAGADLIIMDDGFQYPGLRKDLCLVVVDGAVGFGNGQIIPAGPLREPVARGLARASAVVMMGEDRCDVAQYFGPSLQVLDATLEVTGGGAAILSENR